RAVLVELAASAAERLGQSGDETAVVDLVIAAAVDRAGDRRVQPRLQRLRLGGAEPGEIEAETALELVIGAQPRGVVAVERDDQGPFVAIADRPSGSRFELAGEA